MHNHDDGNHCYTTECTSSSMHNHDDGDHCYWPHVTLLCTTVTGPCHPPLHHDDGNHCYWPLSPLHHGWTAVHFATLLRPLHHGNIPVVGCACSVYACVREMGGSDSVSHRGVEVLSWADVRGRGLEEDIAARTRNWNGKHPNQRAKNNGCEGASPNYE